MTADLQELDGIQFREAGPPGGPTFLLVHGLGGSLHQWEGIQRRTSADWHTIAVDIPGFGEHATRRWQFTVPSATDRLVEFCRSRGLRDCTLVSHSIGSAVGGTLAARLPDVFPRVVFVSGALFRASTIAQHPLRAWRDRRLGLAVGGQFLAGIIPVPGIARDLMARSPLARRLVLWPFVADPSGLDGRAVSDALVGAGSWAVLKILLTAKSIDYMQIMKSVPQPVGLIWGAEDRLTNDADIRMMEKAVNLVARRRVDGCAHWPMLENPDALIEFLGNWERDAPKDDR